MEGTNPCFEIPIGPLEEGVGFVKFDLSAINERHWSILDQYAILKTEEIQVKSKKEHRYITDDWEISNES